MSGKRKTTVDIYTLLQHLRAGASNRRIKRELGIDRRTAQKYRVGNAIESTKDAIEAQEAKE